MRKLIIACFAALAFIQASAQTASAPDTVQYRIRYVINVPEIDTSYIDNAERIAALRRFLRGVSEDPRARITDVDFRATASPDGTYEFNVLLSANRLRTFKELVHSCIDLPDSLIHSNTAVIPWDEFRARVVESEEIPHREEVLSIIDEESRLVPFWGRRHIDARLLKLKRMYDGQVWEALKSPILRDLRYGSAVFTVSYREPLIGQPARPSGIALALSAPPPIVLPPYRGKLWMPQTCLKTNFIGLGMLMANLAVETDIAPHWSVSLPVYFSGVDWFKSTIKFRNFTVQPELRYWFSLKDDGRYLRNDGFFVGAHAELCYYNFAFDGAFRYQDWRGRTPALGGGLALGYRVPFSRNRRWKMEFTVGAGVYPLDYSVFLNTPDVKDGSWVERRKGIYFGPDQAAVTLAYTFDNGRRALTYPKKKGGTGR